VILYGKVYNVTKFLPEHPGGSAAILRLAGTDATVEYDPIHPPGTLEENLSSEYIVGTIDESTVPTHPANDHSTQPTDKNSIWAGAWAESELTASELAQKMSAGSLQGIFVKSLDECLNLQDIESFATTQLSNKAWAYYYSAGDDLYSKQFNNHAYNKILLRPRIFIDCTYCSLTTTLLPRSASPLKLDIPIFVSPAAQARLAHPDGEAGIARACSKFGAMQLISNNASLTPEQIVAASPNGTFGFQLYIQDTRDKSAKVLARIAKLPQIKLICLTLDAPVPGKREHDERRSVGPTQSTANVDLAADPAARAAAAEGGVGKALFAGTATDLTWRTTLPWLAEHTDLPLVLKGIQTHEDALLATRYPQVHGILLSNHGGRALDTAPPAVHTLLEIRRHCPEVFDKVDVWVDGGIKRGTDIVKALCLGAKAVGIGRAALYGLGAGGQTGVEKVLGILQAEVETCVRLLGVEKLEDLNMRHINTRSIERDIYHEPENNLGPKAKL
jgi:L-lactate dehydrogenase (cytochrome)